MERDNRSQIIRRMLAVVMAFVMAMSLLPDSVLRVYAESDEVIVRIVDDSGDPVAGAEVNYKVVLKNRDDVSGGNAGDGDVSGGDVSGGNAGITVTEETGSGVTNAEGEIIILITSFAEDTTVSMEIFKEDYGRKTVLSQAVDRENSHIETTFRKIPEIAILNGPYNGEEQELISEPVPTQPGDEVLYSTDGTNWQMEIPKGKEHGRYSLFVKLSREGYDEYIFTQMEAVIKKLEPEVRFTEKPDVGVVYLDGQEDYIFDFVAECGGFSSRPVTYSVESAAQGDAEDIAQIAEIEPIQKDGKNGGRLTVKRGGYHIRITATAAGDANHEEASESYELTVLNREADLMGFPQPKVEFLLGEDNGTGNISTQAAGKKYEDDDNGVITYKGKVADTGKEPKDIGITVDENSGRVYVDSDTDLDKLSNALADEADGCLIILITASKAEGTKEAGQQDVIVYERSEAQYSIEISTWEIPMPAYTIRNQEGEELTGANGSDGWYNTSVTILPPQGYTIARDRASSVYSESVVFGLESEDQGCKERVVYLRDNDTHAITARIPIDVKWLDNVRPDRIEIDFPEEIVEREGIKYYGEEITVVFTAHDETSGVKSFDWSYRRVGDTESILEADGGTLQAHQDETDKTKYTASLTLPREVAGQLRGCLELSAMDVAGNRSVTLADGGLFVVDTISPRQRIRYGLMDEDGTYQIIGTKHYFSGAVEFIFDIAEANFFAQDVHITVSRDGGPEVEQIVVWETAESADEHEAKLALTEDGDYVVRMTYTDRSGKEMSPYVSETVVVDSTAPVIGFSYADYSGENPQRATITITEHNFRQSDIVVSADARTITDQGVTAGDLQNYLRSCPWISDGDVHTAILSEQFVDAIYVLTCNYNDLALNRAEEVVTERFVVDRTAPSTDKMSVSYSNSLTDTILSAITLGFYNPSVTVTFTAYDETAGVEYFTWGYQRQEEASPENVEFYADRRLEAVRDAEDKAKFTASVTLSGERAEQLRGRISFTATDRYGNTSDELTDSGHVIIVDTISPVMTVEYTVPDNTYEDKAYYNRALTATFTVTEANFYQEDMAVTLTRDDEAPTEIVLTWTDVSTDVHVGTYTIEAPGNHANDGDYVFDVRYTDRSGNTMDTYTSRTMVIDTTAPVLSIGYSNISPVNTLMDGEGYNRRYFAQSLTVNLTIVEHNFHPEEIEYVIKTTDVAGNALGPLYSISGWNGEGDVHTAEIICPGSANYSIDISYRDLALLDMPTYDTEYFTVDTETPADLDVAYDTSVLETILANISFGFYNAAMTVTVTATDHISGVYGFDYSYLNAEGVSGVNAELVEQIIDESRIAFSNGGATGTATFEIPQAALGMANQFNGIISFDAFDRAGNKTEYFQDTKRIVVDNIAPTANVEYNAPVQTVNNISYYDGDIQAVVTVNEANFYPEDMTVSVTRNGAAYVVTPVWGEEGMDVHRGIFTLTEDGDYFVTIAYTDKSGNAMQEYISEQMTIDTGIEEASITVNGADADGKAFKDEVVLEVSFGDTNFENYEISLTRTSFADKNVDVTERFVTGHITTNDTGGSGSFDTFSKTAENDGIYTMTVRLTDKAGHISEKAATFTVNRYGSVYEYSDYLVELIGNGGAYVREVEDDLLITEYNADRLVSQSLNIEISRDGKPLDDFEYTVTPEISDAVATGSSGWYQYQYTIRKENFLADGVYKISVSSRDQTGNAPENTNYDDKAILFRVDSTPPEINSITGLENGVINATSVEVRYTVYDTIGLESVSVFINGGEEEKITDFAEDMQNYSGSVTLAESPQAQTVRLVVRDLAGNITDTDADGFQSAFAFNSLVTVSTNIVVRWFANKALFWSTTGGAVAVVGAGTGGTVLFRRRRKVGRKVKQAGRLPE